MQIIRKEVVPFSLWMVWLVLLTLTVDFFLHKLQLLQVGRYLGIPGTLLIILSFVYTLRKKKIITTGSPKTYLVVHEWLAWSGALLILVHSGIHFNAILPWVATAAMFLAVASGLLGKYVLQRSRKSLQARMETLKKELKSEDEAEQILFWDSIAVKAMTQWRVVHKPITAVFGILAFVHIFVSLLFWNF